MFIYDGTATYLRCPVPNHAAHVVQGHISAHCTRWNGRRADIKGEWAQRMSMLVFEFLFIIFVPVLCEFQENCSSFLNIWNRPNIWYKRSEKTTRMSDRAYTHPLILRLKGVGAQSSDFMPLN